MTIKLDSTLIKKYNTPGPRYTSYPTVPYWNETPPTIEHWKDALVQSYNIYKEKGLSIYIHLPFCESLCTYCGCNTRITTNHHVEQPYIETILKEWQMYIDILGEKPLIKEIHLGGGTPTFFAPVLLSFLIEKLLEKGIVADDPQFSFEAHPNSTTQTHLEALAKQRFTRMSLGVQDLDPKVQDIIHRIQTFEEIKNATLMARDLGYTSINFDLIYGLPLQTSDSVNMTIDKVCELMPDRIALYSFGFIPWVKPGQRKFTEADLPNDDNKRALYEISKTKLLDAGYIEIGMDHFSLPHDSLYTSMQQKSLHRNFMGYTPAYSKISLALGVSSISDSWNAFAQNYKTLEQYTQSVSEGNLPIMRGHLLNKEDLIIRKHILSLMCQFETEITDEERHLPYIQQSLHRLQEMIQDKLIILEDNKIKVPQKGIPFVRNVCMAFDVRLWRKLPTTRMFSATI